MKKHIHSIRAFHFIEDHIFDHYYVIDESFCSLIVHKKDKDLSAVSSQEIYLDGNFFHQIKKNHFFGQSSFYFHKDKTTSYKDCIDYFFHSFNLNVTDDFDFSINGKNYHMNSQNELLLKNAIMHQQKIDFSKRFIVDDADNFFCINNFNALIFVFDHLDSNKEYIKNFFLQLSYKKFIFEEENDTLQENKKTNNFLNPYLSLLKEYFNSEEIKNLFKEYFNSEEIKNLFKQYLQLHTEEINQFSQKSDVLENIIMDIYDDDKQFQFINFIKNKYQPVEIKWFEPTKKFMISEIIHLQDIKKQFSISSLYLYDLKDMLADYFSIIDSYKKTYTNIDDYNEDGDIIRLTVESHSNEPYMQQNLQNDLKLLSDMIFKHKKLSYYELKILLEASLIHKSLDESKTIKPIKKL